MASGNYNFDAVAAYNVICDTLDDDKFRYDRNDESLGVELSIRGDGMPVAIRMSIKPKTKMISVYSRLPFTIVEDKRVDMALGVCVVNSNFINGGFDIDVTDGVILFRMSNNLSGCELTPDMVRYMLFLSYQTVESYSDKFYMFNKGMISLDKILDSEN